MVHRVSGKDDTIASSSATRSPSLRKPSARPRKKENVPVAKPTGPTRNRRNSVAVDNHEKCGEDVTKSRGKGGKGCVQGSLVESSHSVKNVPSLLREKVAQKESSDENENADDDDDDDGEKEENEEESSEDESESSSSSSSDGDTDDDVSISNLMRKQKCDLDKCESGGTAKNVHLRCSLPLNRLSEGVLDTLTNGGKGTKSPDEISSSGGNKFLCLYCDRSFATQDVLTKHANRLHRSTAGRRSSARNVLNATPTEFSGCSFCNNAKTFSSFATDLVSLFQHMIEKHSDRYFGCRECNIRLPTVETFHKHRKSVHRDLPRDVQKSPDLGDIDFEDSILTNSITKTTAQKISETKNVSNTHQGRKMMTRLSKMNKKHQLLRSEGSMLSRLGVAQNRSPRTRKGSKGRPLIESRGTSETRSSSCGRVSRSKSGRSTTSTGGTSAANDSTDFSISSSSKSFSSKEVLSGTFDEDFYENVSVNVRKNLNCFLDGKIGVDPETPSIHTKFTEAVPAVPSTVVRSSYMTDNEIHEATSLATITAFPTLLTAEQYGTNNTSPNKSKRTITKNSWKWKWDFVKKYKYVNEGGKIVKKIKQQTSGVRDLSKLDMWTQLTMRTKHEVVQRNCNSEQGQGQPVVSSDVAREEKRKLIEQLNTILDSRLLPQIVLEQNDQRLIKVEPVDSVEDSVDVSTSAATPPEATLVPFEEDKFAATLNLQRSSGERHKEAREVILSGEWARPRCYVCFGCGAKFETIKSLEEHKNTRHPHVYSTHYEIVGRELIEGDLYKHFFIPAKALRRRTPFARQVSSDDSGTVEDSMDSTTSGTISTKCDSFDTDSNSRMSNKSAEVTVCTKCKKECTGMMELYRHMLDCVGDYAWLMAKRRLRYRYYGNRSRRRRANATLRFGCLRSPKPPKTPEHRAMNTTPKKQQSPQQPRQRPSDADSIQRMLANLPAKRSSRSVHTTKPMPIRRRKLIATTVTNKFTKRNTRTSLLAAKSSTLLLRSKNKSEGKNKMQKHLKQSAERKTRSGNIPTTNVRKLNIPKRVTRSSESPNSGQVSPEGVTTRNKTKQVTPVKKDPKEGMPKLTNKLAKSPVKNVEKEPPLSPKNVKSVNEISKKNTKEEGIPSKGQKNGKTRKMKLVQKIDEVKTANSSNETESTFLEEPKSNDQDDLVEVKEIMDSIIERASAAADEDKSKEDNTHISSPAISIETTPDTSVAQKIEENPALTSPTSATPGKRRVRKLTDCIARLTDKLQEKLGKPFLENTETSVLSKTSDESVNIKSLEIVTRVEDLQKKSEDITSSTQSTNKSDVPAVKVSISEMKSAMQSRQKDLISMNDQPLVSSQIISASMVKNTVPVDSSFPLPQMVTLTKVKPSGGCLSTPNIPVTIETVDAPLNLTIRKPTTAPNTSADSTQPVCLVKHQPILKIPVVQSHLGSRLHSNDIDVVIDLSSKTVQGKPSIPQHLSMAGPSRMHESHPLSVPEALNLLHGHSIDRLPQIRGPPMLSSHHNPELLNNPRCGEILAHTRSAEILRQPRPELIVKHPGSIIQIPQVPVKSVKPRQPRKPRAKAANSSSRVTKATKEISNVDMKASAQVIHVPQPIKIDNNNLELIPQIVASLNKENVSITLVQTAPPPVVTEKASEESLQNVSINLEKMPQMSPNIDRDASVILHEKSSPKENENGRISQLSQNTEEKAQISVNKSGGRKKPATKAQKTTILKQQCQKQDIFETQEALLIETSEEQDKEKTVDNIEELKSLEVTVMKTQKPPTKKARSKKSEKNQSISENSAKEIDTSIMLETSESPVTSNVSKISDKVEVVPKGKKQRKTNKLSEAMETEKSSNQNNTVTQSVEDTPHIDELSLATEGKMVVGKGKKAKSTAPKVEKLPKDKPMVLEDITTETTESSSTSTKTILDKTKRKSKAKAAAKNNEQNSAQNDATVHVGENLEKITAKEESEIPHLDEQNLSKQNLQESSAVKSKLVKSKAKVQSKKIQGESQDKDQIQKNTVHAESKSATAKNPVEEESEKPIADLEQENNASDSKTRKQPQKKGRVVKPTNKPQQIKKKGKIEAQEVAPDETLVESVERKESSNTSTDNVAIEENVQESRANNKKIIQKKITKATKKGKIVGKNQDESNDTQSLLNTLQTPQVMIEDIVKLTETSKGCETSLNIEKMIKADVVDKRISGRGGKTVTEKSTLVAKVVGKGKKSTKANVTAESSNISENKFKEALENSELKKVSTKSQPDISKSGTPDPDEEKEKEETSQNSKPNTKTTPRSKRLQSVKPVDDRIPIRTSREDTRKPEIPTKTIEEKAPENVEDKIKSVPKPRKRRKNELAAIIADQLLESFKEVDKSKLDDLKILHDLSCEANPNSDELLMSNALEIVTTTKRKASMKTNTVEPVPAKKKVTKATKEINSEILSPSLVAERIESQFQTPAVEVEAVDTPAKPRKSSGAKIANTAKAKAVSKEKKDSVISNLLRKMEDKGDESSEGDSSRLSSATSRSSLRQRKKEEVQVVKTKEVPTETSDTSGENNKEGEKSTLDDVNTCVTDSLNLLAAMDMNTIKAIQSEKSKVDISKKPVDWISRVVDLPKIPSETISKTPAASSTKSKFVLKPSRLQALRPTVPDPFEELKSSTEKETPIISPPPPSRENKTTVSSESEKKNGESSETVAKLVDKIRESEGQTDSDDDTCLAEIAKSLNNRIQTTDEFTDVADTLPVAETPCESPLLIPSTVSKEVIEEANTDPVDMDLEDGMSVLTTGSVDSGITTNTKMGSQKGVTMAKKRKFRRSVLYKSKKTKVTKPVGGSEPATFFCDICKKHFTRQDRLTKHKMTITHIAKLSEKEFLDAQKSRATEEKENETENDKNIENNLPEEEQKVVDVIEKTVEVEDAKILQRSPVSTGIEPISSPEQVQVPTSTEQYPSPVRSLNPGTPRLNLSQEEKLFYECCNMLKGSNRIGAQSENKSLTPKSNEQPSNCFGGSHSAVYCVKSPMSHRRSSPKHAYPKIDINQFSDISSDSNPIFSRPAKFAQSKGIFDDHATVNNQLSGFLANAEKFLNGAASTSNSLYFNDKIVDTIPPIGGINPKDPSVTTKSFSDTFSDMGDSFPSSQDASESENYAQTILDRPGSNKTLETDLMTSKEDIDGFGGAKLFNDKNLSERSVVSPINSTASSQCSTASKVRTKGAMKGYDNFKVSIPTNGLDLQQALVKNPHVNSKLAALADIALSTDIPAITKDIVATACEEETSKVSSREGGKSSVELCLSDSKCDPPVKVPKAKKSKEDIGNRLGFKSKKKAASKDKNDTDKEQEKTSSKNPLDIYEFEESKDSVDAPILPLSKRTFFRANLDVDLSRNKSKAEKLPAECNEQKAVSKKPENEDNASQMSSTSFSDRDDFNYNSNVSDSDSESASTSPKLPITPKKTKKLPDPVQKKSLIMGRIFKNAKKDRPSNEIKKTPATEPEVTKRPILQKQELDKLFDSLKSDGGSGEVKAEGSSDLKSQIELTDTHMGETSGTQDQCSNSGTSDVRRNAASRKCRELAMFEAELGMSLEQIEEIIGIGKRKSQRKCAVGKQKILAETWSSDEYEDFQTTKDIIALIQEKELKSSQRAWRNQRRRESQKNQSLRGIDDSNENQDDSRETWDVRRALGLQCKKTRAGKKAVRIAGGSDVETSQKTRDPPARPAKIKKRRQTVAYRATEPSPSPERDIPMKRVVKRRSSVRGATSDGESGGKKGKKVKFPESSKEAEDKKDPTWKQSRPMARSKRRASEMLYYWSSSSDDEFGRINNSRDDDDDDDLSQEGGECLQQHGWIVGDSHKKLVTLLAHAKGKKTEDCSVKETSNGNSKKKSSS
ncbi:hypothetical protein DMENIID0001_103040 [Sergentomyia squamirostris]